MPPIPSIAIGRAIRSAPRPSPTSSRSIIAQPLSAASLSTMRRSPRSRTTAPRPTLTTRIIALERSGQLLTRVGNVFYNLTSSDNTDALQAVQTEMAPILSRHQSEVLLNPDLFARVHAVYEQRASLHLTPEQNRLVERTHLGFVRAGAQLDAPGRTRLAAIQERLSTLSTDFDHNLLADTNAWSLTLNGERDLAGLPASVREALCKAATITGMTANTSSPPRARSSSRSCNIPRAVICASRCTPPSSCAATMPTSITTAP